MGTDNYIVFHFVFSINVSCVTPVTVFPQHVDTVPFVQFLEHLNLNPQELCKALTYIKRKLGLLTQAVKFFACTDCP